MPLWVKSLISCYCYNVFVIVVLYITRWRYHTCLLTLQVSTPQVAGSIMGRGESLAPSRAGSIRPSSPGAQSLAGSIRPPSPCASIRSRADSIRPPSAAVSAAGSYVHPLRQDLDAPIQDDGFGGSMTGTGQVGRYHTVSLIQL